MWLVSRHGVAAAILMEANVYDLVLMVMFEGKLRQCWRFACLQQYVILDSGSHRTTVVVDFVGRKQHFLIFEVCQ
jgi:hypothetical protein